MTAAGARADPTDEKLKNFQLDPKKGSTSNVDIIPPPLLSRSDVPFRYMCVLSSFPLTPDHFLCLCPWSSS